MTSVSAPPAPTSGGYEKSPPKKGGIDYSKFDSIVDSDDEKPSAKNSTDAGKKAATEEKPHCHNCMKDIEKPLRCGVCKKVSYCSPACQKSDWSFHKRNCKKPEEPKPKARPQEKAAKKEVKEEKKKQNSEEKIIEDSDETLTWYRHREWKPTTEEKKEFKPRQIDDTTDRSMVEDSKARGGDGAVWNAAGTWEDKDVTEMAKRTLKEKLEEPFTNIDVAGGSICVVEVEKVEGDASKPVIQKKRRHLFELSFKVKFRFKWMDSTGQQQADGTLEVNDFSNDAFNSDGDNAPVFSMSFKATSLDAARKKAVEEAIATKPWRPPAWTLCGMLVDRMEAWTQDYQAM